MIRAFLERGGQRLARAMAAVSAAAMLGGVALAGWGDNPDVLSTTIESFVTLPMKGAVIVAQVQDNAIEIRRLNTLGNPVGSLSWSDPDYSMDEDQPLVGARLGGNRFALGYSVSASSNLRVVFVRWNGLGFVVEAGFPKTIGSGFGLQMDSNFIRAKYAPFPIVPGWNGVMMCWLHAYGTGPHSPVAVRQQGLRNDGTFVWDGANESNGAYVDDTLQLDNLPFGKAHSITADFTGLAIVTYLTDASPITYSSTKLDTDASTLFSELVPGQDGLSIDGPCLMTRDGDGGAFYAFTRDAAVTELVVAQIRSDGLGGYSLHDASYVAAGSVTPLMRVLTLVPTPGQTAVVAYRDEVANRVIKFGASASFLWQSFLSGAGLDNSEQAHGVAGPCGVYFAWTRYDDIDNRMWLLSKRLNLQDGSGPWDFTPNAEVEVNDPTGVFSLPRRPCVVNSKNTGAIVTWFEEATMIKAERIRCSDGNFGL